MGTSDDNACRKNESNPKYVRILNVFIQNPIGKFLKKYEVLNGIK